MNDNDPNSLPTNTPEVSNKMEASRVEALMVGGLERTELNTELGKSVRALIDRMNTNDRYWNTEDESIDFGYASILGVELTDKIRMHVSVAVSHEHSALVGTANWLPQSENMILGFETYGIPLSEVSDTHGDPDYIEYNISSLGTPKGPYKVTYPDGSSVGNEGMEVIIEALGLVPSDSE